MDDSVVLVFTTFPDIATARHIGTELLTRQCVACVNLLPASESIYRWEGELCRQPEVVVLIKTTRRVLPTLEGAILDLHPYACPELLAIEVVAGLPAYLQWVADAVGHGSGG